MISNFVNHIQNKSDVKVILDIGSRDCEQSVEFYNEFPNATIIAFECNPNTLPLCRAKTNDRIKLVEGAVTDYDGTITFYPINQQLTKTTWKDGNPGASSIFKSNGKYTVENYVQDEIQTNCHRLDTVLQNMGIEKVDIIWMDLQGAELLALKGLGKYLENVDFIHTEVSYKPIYENQVMSNELESFIIKAGFVEIGYTDRNQNLWQTDIIFRNNKLNKFDIVICVGPNDLDFINTQIEYTKKYINNFNNIFLISCDPSLSIAGTITVNEQVFPFSKNDVNNIIKNNERCGWYYQQLLKWYAPFVIKNLSDKYLVLDSDTLFLKPTNFVSNDGKCMYAYGSEYHLPYFNHMNKLHPLLNKMVNVSGICHHMMFEKQIIMEICALVEQYHNLPFFNCFLNMVDPMHWNGSGASEYEIYFNFIIKNHRNSIVVRHLNWSNVRSLENILSPNNSYDYVSYHHYLRQNK